MRDVWNRPATPVRKLAQRSSSSSPTPHDNGTHSTCEVVSEKYDMAVQVANDILDPLSAFWRWSMPYSLDDMKESWNTLPTSIKGAFGVVVGNVLLVLFLWLSASWF
jgi:hypothetical protein